MSVGLVILCRSHVCGRPLVRGLPEPWDWSRICGRWGVAGMAAMTFTHNNFNHHHHHFNHHSLLVTKIIIIIFLLFHITDVLASVGVI